MRSSQRRLVAALVALTALALGVVWLLASVLTSVANDVVSPRIVMSGSESAQSAPSGAPAVQEGAQSSSSPDSGEAAPVETPTPITPTPPIDLDDDDDLDDADDDGDDD